MSYKHKNLLDEIRKYAQGMPSPGKPKGAAPPPGGGGSDKGAGPPGMPMPGKVAPSGGGGGSGGGYSYTATASIREMQEAMQVLAESVIRDSESATMGAKPKDQKQPEADVPTKTSKKAFNDFIAEQYVGSLDEENKGVEWTKDQKVTTLPGKKTTETDIYELDVVMNTFQRIGKEKSEFKADGNWEFRTDNALRNMMGFAYALLQLEGDFGLPNNIYQYANWRAFQALLSGYKVQGGIVKLTSAEKEQKAVEITKHLKAITKLYNHFRQQVTARPEYRPLIEGKRAFDKYNKAGSNKDVLTSAETQYASTNTAKIENIIYIAQGLPNKKLDYVPLKALRSKADYLKWMMEYAGNSEGNAIKIFNNIIKPKIESM